MKPFDEKFADNVREAFDQWQEEMPPDAWNAMSARLQGKGKGKVVAFWPFLAKAAGVALLAGMSVYWYVGFSPKGNEKFAASQKSTQAVEPANDAPASVTLLAPKDPAYTPHTTATQITTTLKAPLHTTLRVVSPPAAKSAVAEEPMIVALAVPAAQAAVVEEKPLAPEPGVQKETPVQEQQKAPESPRLAINHIAEPLPAAIATRPGRLTWGIAAGSMLAFAENSVSDAPGYNAGITAEFALTDQIRLSAGGLLTYHQFELVNFSNAEFANDYLPDNTNLAQVKLTGNNQYEMLALEIPLNAQFNLMETRGRRLYLSTGFSSLLYLQQRFTGINTAFFESKVFNQTTGRYDLQYNATTFEVNEEYPALSRFDFGRLLNLSLGYVIRREKGAMVIEPFVKLPIGTITSRNLNLGMGGISVKYRFSGN